MDSSGVRSVVRGDGAGNLIVANHPTLLDVVFLVSLLPTTLCVVKKAAWSNPFFTGVMWATGYIQSDDPIDLIADCVNSFQHENNLLIFPEATRTVPGRPMKLMRGAASVIVKSRQKMYRTEEVKRTKAFLATPATPATSRNWISANT